MGNKVTIGGSGRLFLGEDKDFVLEVLTDLPENNGVPVNMTSWNLKLMVKIRDTDADGAAVLTLTGVVAGTFAADRATNQQRATFSATDTQLEALSARTYSYSIKRTDDSSETIVAYGPFKIERTTQVA